MPIEIKDGMKFRVPISDPNGPAGTFKISGVAINSAARPNPTTGVIDRSIASFVLVSERAGSSGQSESSDQS